MARPSLRTPRERPPASAALCCSRSRPMWSQAPAGNYRCSKERSSHCRVSSSACSPFRQCILARRKLQVANGLGSRALRADAVESITCGWLAFVVVGALVAQLIVGAWWVDALASIGIVWFVIREGREAWKGEDCCDQHRK